MLKKQKFHALYLINGYCQIYIYNSVYSNMLLVFTVHLIFTIRKLNYFCLVLIEVYQQSHNLLDHNKYCNIASPLFSFNHHIIHITNPLSCCYWQSSLNKTKTLMHTYIQFGIFVPMLLYFDVLVVWFSTDTQNLYLILI